LEAGSSSRATGFLQHVLGLVEVVHQRKRRTEGRMLNCRVKSTEALTSPSLARWTCCL
jgi:hypothetical protein